MRFGVKVATIASILALCWALTAGAVGYERVPVGKATEPAGSSDVKPGTNGNSKGTAWSFLENYPTYLDQVAEAVRDVLGQFGLSSNKER